MSLENFKWRVRPPTDAERAEWMKHHTNFPMDWKPFTRPTRAKPKPNKDELCASCKYRKECEDRPEDMMVDLCSQYEEAKK